MAATDFVGTAHALERMVEHWPEDFELMNDDLIAAFIHEEVTLALESGRHAQVPPLELIAPNPHMHLYRSTGVGECCWTKDKLRGYAYRIGDDGLVVMTAFKGQPQMEARKKLQQK